MPEPTGPRTGPCSPWTEAAAVERLPWVQDAVAKLTAKQQLSDDQLNDICTLAAAAASGMLYELSGRVYTGACGPVTVRPVERPRDSDSRTLGARLAPLGWFASWGLGSSYGMSAPGVLSHYGRTEPPEVELPYPVLKVEKVTIDGIEIPSAEYELRGYKTLVKVNPENHEPTSGHFTWPSTQRQDKKLGELGTFGVTFTFGITPPASGVLAAQKLAEYLALPQLGDASRYPKRVTSLQRQGVSAAITDVMDVLRSGSLGIYEVDAFLLSVNPKKLQRQATVWSPDIARARRVPNPS